MVNFFLSEVSSSLEKLKSISGEREHFKVKVKASLKGFLLYIYLLTYNAYNKKNFKYLFENIDIGNGMFENNLIMTYL